MSLQPATGPAAAQNTLASSSRHQHRSTRREQRKGEGSEGESIFLASSNRNRDDASALASAKATRQRRRNNTASPPSPTRTQLAEETNNARGRKSGQTKKFPFFPLFLYTATPSVACIPTATAMLVSLSLCLYAVAVDPFGLVIEEKSVTTTRGLKLRGSLSYKPLSRSPLRLFPFIARMQCMLCARCKVALSCAPSAL